MRGPRPEGDDPLADQAALGGELAPAVAVAVGGDPRHGVDPDQQRHRVARRPLELGEQPGQLARAEHGALARVALGAGVGHHEAHPADVEDLRDRPVGVGGQRQWIVRQVGGVVEPRGVAGRRAAVRVVGAVVVVVPDVGQRRAAVEERLPFLRQHAIEPAPEQAGQRLHRLGRPADVVVVEVAHVDEHMGIERRQGGEDAAVRHVRQRHHARPAGARGERRHEVERAAAERAEAGERAGAGAEPGEVLGGWLEPVEAELAEQALRIRGRRRR